MKKSATKDMTEGKPLKLILAFAIPTCIGMMFQQLYSMVDTMLVGRLLGVNPLAGVGSTTSINFMITFFCIGVCSGFAIPIAQKFGAKEENELRKYLANSVWLGSILATITTVSTGLLVKPMLTALGTSPEVFDYAYHYIFIIFMGLPCTYLYNFLTGVSRSLGDSKSPLMFLAFSSVLNIILDVIFMLPLGMGVRGAALATVISQGVSGILCLVYMWRKFDIIHLSKEEWQLRPNYIKQLCQYGLPMGLQYFITGIGMIAVQMAMNAIGATAVASVVTAQKILSFIVCPLEALGQTMATYSGQNTGAGKIERVKQGLKSAVYCGFTWSVLCIPILYFTGKPLIMLFLDEINHEVIAFAFQYLMVSVLAHSLLTLVNTVRFAIQGMGYSQVAIIAGALETVARTSAAFILAPLLGFTGVCFSDPLAWLAADLFLIPCFISCVKKETKRLATKSLVVA